MTFNGIRNGLAAMAVVTALMLPGAAGAVIVAGPTLNGYDTFTDNGSGLHWMRLDSFFGESYNSMAAAAGLANFTVADIDDVNALLLTLPLDGGQWTDYAAIMGRAPARELIWGAFLPTNPDWVSWAYSSINETAWSFTTGSDSGTGLDAIPNEDEDEDIADMNLFAYYTGPVIDPDPGAVPEPITSALLAGGLFGLGWLRRRTA